MLELRRGTEVFVSPYLRDSLRDILTRLGELNQQINYLKNEINRLTERYYRWKSKKTLALLHEKTRELQQLESELKSLREEENKVLEEFVDKVLAPIHPSFRSLGKIYGMEKYHGVELAPGFKLCGETIDEPVIAIRAHYFDVYTPEELGMVFRRLERVSEEYETPIVLIVDSRPDHFPLTLKHSNEIRENPHFLCEYTGSYIFVFKPNK